MNKLDLFTLACQCLSGQLDLPGSILYSGHETLRRGDIYLLGFNPGGTRGHTLGVNIDAMFVKSDNAAWTKVGEMVHGFGPSVRHLCKIVSDGCLKLSA